jgi:GntR family transcriptional regulator
MKVNPESATPLYQQLKNVLLKKIAIGEYPVGARLPSERELCEIHSMSRMTVRKSLNELAQEGWIHTQQGKGTFVGSPKMSQGLFIMGFTERIENLGMTPSSSVIDQYVQEASGDVASRLDLPTGAPVLYLHRVRLADDVPVLLEEGYVSVATRPQVIEYDFSQHSLYQVLRDEYGIILNRADQSLEAVLARPEDGELLQIELPAAVMLRTRVTYATTGEALEYVRGRYRGDRYKFDITLHQGIRE